MSVPESQAKKVPIPPEVLREQRMKASRRASHMTNQQMMEQMWRNGSQRKPNPFVRGQQLKKEG